MNREQANTLKKGDTILDSEGTEFTVIKVDDEWNPDPWVECRAAMNGRILLDYTMCTKKVES